MHRLHLFEFGDQPWLRGPLRHAYLECLDVRLRLGLARSKVHRLIARGASRVGSAEVLDLASGGGGSIAGIIAAAAADGTTLPRFILSDLHPDLEHFRHMEETHGPERIGFVPEPVPADRVPPGLPRVRMISFALHHFRPEEARAVIEDALRSGDGLIVIEPGERSWGRLLGAVLSTPIALLLGILTPFLGRASWATVLLCTLLPVAPLLVHFDGLVSILRCYGPEEIEDLMSLSTLDAFATERGEPGPVTGVLFWRAKGGRGALLYHGWPSPDAR